MSMTRRALGAGLALVGTGLGLAACAPGDTSVWHEAGPGLTRLILFVDLDGDSLLSALPEEAQKSLGDSIPYPRRLGAPEEFASLVAHMVENRFLNGEVVRLDGALRLPPK